ncbi:MAG: NAD(P)H-dependent oxidoreductase subunit E, partial [Bacteroidales bacterium]|nr:NAD(P)H-dependent oxidoreductase subunit E [Bacteroidales bacterium]
MNTTNLNDSKKEEKGIKYTYDEVLQTIIDEMSEHGSEVTAVAPILLGVQKKLKYIPDDAIKIVSRLTKATPIQVTEIATFYSKLRREPVGQHNIQICSGLACHQNNAAGIEKAIREYLNI